jgi:hypothetical protein
MNIRIDCLVAGMHRVSDYFYKLSLAKMILEIQEGSAETYRKMIHDADFKLEADFERELARQLSNGGRWDLIPAETLMPVMMARFGVSESDISTSESSQLEALELACNSCPVLGACWKSMRSRTSVAEARNFCPSAEIFERLGEGVQ